MRNVKFDSGENVSCCQSPISKGPIISADQKQTYPRMSVVCQNCLNLPNYGLGIGKDG